MDNWQKAKQAWSAGNIDTPTLLDAGDAAMEAARQEIAQIKGEYEAYKSTYDGEATRLLKELTPLAVRYKEALQEIGEFVKVDVLPREVSWIRRRVRAALQQQGGEGEAG